jgi:hypothetical protein
MQQPPDHALVGALIEAISTRPRAQGDQLAAALMYRSWPGGAEDRTEPYASEWLRRWRPGGVAPAPFACSCDEGHCHVCN